MPYDAAAEEAKTAAAAPEAKADGKAGKAVKRGRAGKSDKASRKAKAETRSAWRNFKVDLWATDLNDVEFGILRDEQNRAQSRQFTKDMNVIGQVRRDGERDGLIGWREELWDRGEGMKRRLVLKLFTESLNWSGSLDLMMGRSLQLSHGAGVPVAAYSVNLARHDQVIQIERCARKLPLFPERFSFFIMDDDNVPQYFRLRRDRFRPGADYTLYDQTGRKVGHIDHRIFNLGGAWKVKLHKDVAHARLEHALTLFCAMLRFNGACRKHVAKLKRAIAQGKADTKIDHQEADLYMNPRRVR
ncbi:MAG: hypothetical protein AAF253_06865 [Pseudomonadota bacterium]